MFFIVFNQNNIVPDGKNNKLVYKFPNSVNLEDKYVAVTSVSMFYSWFNITQAYSNNYFTYVWYNGATPTTYTCTIPDGTYDISDINNFFQFCCIQNGTYWVDPAGVNYYPAEFILNPPRYAVQINTYYVPTSLPAGWTAPPAGLPTTSYNTVITIPASLNIILGFTAGFQTDLNSGGGYTPPVGSQYISKDNTTQTISYISTQAPQVQPNSNVLLTLSGVNNPYTQPSSVIYSINPSVSTGEQITVTPPNFAWVKFIRGTYNELRLSFLGSNNEPININDPNMTIILAIRDKDESIIASK